MPRIYRHDVHRPWIIGIYEARVTHLSRRGPARKILWPESLNIDGFMNVFKIMTDLSHWQLHWVLSYGDFRIGTEGCELGA